MWCNSSQLFFCRKVMNLQILGYQKKKAPTLGIAKDRGLNFSNSVLGKLTCIKTSWILPIMEWGTIQDGIRWLMWIVGSVLLLTLLMVPSCRLLKWLFSRDDDDWTSPLLEAGGRANSGSWLIYVNWWVKFARLVLIATALICITATVRIIVRGIVALLPAGKQEDRK